MEANALYIFGLVGQSGQDWAGYIIGALVGAAVALILGIFSGFFAWVRRWWRENRPVHLVLQRVGHEREPVLVFVRDFELPLIADAAGGPPRQVPLLTRDPRAPPGVVGGVKNVLNLWSRVEAMAYGDLLYLLSRVGKTRNLELVEMSKDSGDWDGSLVVLGAQAERCYQFYEQMTGVAFSMTRDGKDIRDETTDPPSVVPRTGNYGYGIILKARNPHRTKGGPGTAFLIGGYGVLGTEAAGHYLRTRVDDLARTFGKRTFGVVVRADVNAGAKAVQRLPEYDRATESKSNSRKLWEAMTPFSRKQVDVR